MPLLPGRRAVCVCGGRGSEGLVDPHPPTMTQVSVTLLAVKGIILTLCKWKTPLCPLSSLRKTLRIFNEDDTVG